MIGKPLDIGLLPSTPKSGLVTLTGPVLLPFLATDFYQRYDLPYLWGALDQPGEWFLTRNGQLYYKPRPGENLADRQSRRSGRARTVYSFCRTPPRAAVGGPYCPEGVEFSVWAVPSSSRGAWRHPGRGQHTCCDRGGRCGRHRP